MTDRRAQDHVTDHGAERTSIGRRSDFVSVHARPVSVVARLKRAGVQPLSQRLPPRKRDLLGAQLVQGGPDPVEHHVERQDAVTEERLRPRDPGAVEVVGTVEAHVPQTDPDGPQDHRCVDVHPVESRA
ncbi:hypothetical protein [Micromonospora aurantiaca (nom. illeg.)]|uniref:hypothetical protein n=1 Tax=Micromonospora aurantiaca (nom. illeg.) TaxID=47850 RepID=UPI0033C9F4E8